MPDDHTPHDDTPPPSAPPFAVLYADPPWHPKGGVRLPYPTMSTPAICALPMSLLCAEDCCLFLWATHGRLPDALRVLAAWGFTYKTVAFTWVKANRTRPGFFAGQGGWTRANPEVCLLGTRGRPKRASAAVANLVVSPRREHSRKPEEVRERIVSLCGDVARAELFAREKVDGWAAWGDEVECDFALPGASAPRTVGSDCRFGPARRTRAGEAT